jgi:putative hydrolase of the HAD superfamily
VGERFDAVLFDAGGVLVLPDPTVLAPLLAPYGGSAAIDAHRRAHYAAMAVKSMVGAGETDWHEYNVAYVEAVGVEEHLVDHAAVVLHHTRTAHLWRWPIPESLAALERLAEADVPMGVVSNASGQIEEVLRISAVCSVAASSAGSSAAELGSIVGTAMRCIVDSHVVGVAKPDPRIFEHALAHFAEFDRSRILYVGDSVKMDVGGARAAGLHPLLVDPHDDHAGADFDRIRSLADLPAWLT